jgi:ParB family chromosome partitioning protein
VVDKAGTPADKPGRTSQADELRLLPLSLIDPRPDQPRRRSRPASLQELTGSVAAVGVLQPIRVRRSGERFEIVAGHRRWSAARLAGLAEIPAVIVDRDDDAAFVEALIENVHREDLALVDRADAIRRVRAALGLTNWEAVGRALGLSRGHLHRLLAITRLPDSMREDPRFVSLTEKHVRALSRLRDQPAEQLRLWERIHADGMSGEQALAAGDALLHDAPADASAAVDVVSSVRAATSSLASLMAQLDAHSAGAVHDDLARVHAALGRLLAGATDPDADTAT